MLRTADVTVDGQSIGWAALRQAAVVNRDGWLHVHHFRPPFFASGPITPSTLAWRSMHRRAISRAGRDVFFLAAHVVQPPKVLGGQAQVEQVVCHGSYG